MLCKYKTISDFHQRFVQNQKLLACSNTFFSGGCVVELFSSNSNHSNKQYVKLNWRQQQTDWLHKIFKLKLALFVILTYLLLFRIEIYLIAFQIQNFPNRISHFSIRTISKQLESFGGDIAGALIYGELTTINKFDTFASSKWKRINGRANDNKQGIGSYFRAVIGTHLSNIVSAIVRDDLGFKRYYDIKLPNSVHCLLIY